MSAATIQVCGRSVYGQIKIYPVNDPAKVLAELVGKATLSQLDLARAETLGLVVEFVADPKMASVLGVAA